MEPDAREAAKRAARSAGMTLGAWLNQKLLESERASGGASSASQAGSREFRVNEPSSFGPVMDPRGGPAPYADRDYGRPAPELGGVTQSIDALRRHLQDADNRAERTYGQVSRSLEAMLTKLDKVSERRRTETGDETSDGMGAINSALGEVNQRLSLVETRPGQPFDIAGIERSVGDINRSFDAANNRITQRIDHIENSMERIADRTEQRDGRRMDAIRGLERAVTEIVNRVDDVARRQSDAARDTDRTIADLRNDLGQNNTGMSPSLDLLRERIFELSAQLEANRVPAGQAVAEQKLTDFERRIADALDNTAKAEDLVRLETRVMETAEATVQSAIQAVQHGLREELLERVDASESRSAAAIQQLQSDIIDHLQGEAEEREKLSLPPVGHNAPELSELESRLAERFEQMSAQLDLLAHDVDARLDEVSIATRNEIDALHDKLEGREEGTKTSFAEEPFDAAMRSASERASSSAAPQPALVFEPEPEPQNEEDESIRLSHTEMRDRLRQDATRPSETGVRFIDRDIDRDDERSGVRTSIALFVILLLILSAGLIGYSGWRMWSSGQLEITLPEIPWLNPAPIEQPIRQPATPEPIAPEPVETAERTNDPDQDIRVDTQIADAETETIPPVEVTPEPRADTAAPTPVAALPNPQANVVGPAPAQLYAEALELLEDGADVEAARLLEEAADMGLTIAQFRLATLYETGRGVPQDNAAARDWYAQAAEGGNARAMHNLAVLYAEGTVTGTPDYAEAARWFAEGASYDIRDSQYNLAVLFERGLGVRTDMRQAYLWYSIASLGGDTEAASRSTNLTNRLADSVRTRIDAAVMNWEPRPLDPIANGQLSVSHPLGATPREIMLAQQLLVTIGFAPGPADGMMGTQTANAIRDFQRSAGMAVTGRVTPELISRLERAVAARSSGG